MPKFIQIVCCPGFENKESSVMQEPVLYALGEDVNVYLWDDKEWVLVK